MNISWRRPKAPKPGDPGITFPLLECWSPITASATFAAEVNGERVMCRIEASVLRKVSPALADTPMKALAANRDTIHAAAQRLIEQGRFEDDGTVVVRDGDL